MSKLEKLFEDVEKASYELWKKEKRKNGLKFWKPIKEVLLEHDEIKASKWKSLNRKVVKKIMSMPEYEIDGYGDKTILEVNHFIIQQVRIPKKLEPTLRKIIQVALNIGQFRGSASKKFKKFVEYDGTGLDNIKTYLSSKDIKKLSEEIPDTLIEKIQELLEKN